MSRRERRELSLKEKVMVIEASPGQSQRQLAEHFNIGRTQVGNILKRKAELLEDYERCSNPDIKRRCLTPISSQLDDQVFSWFSNLVSLNCPVSGPMICSKAIDVAKELGMTDFKGSSGWLTKFKKRHNIAGFKRVGENSSVDVSDDTTVTEWLESLPSIVQSYDPRDVFNVDETGLFCRAFPERGIELGGSKKCEERVTALFCCNMLGEFEKTMVIGKAARPRCWRNADLTALPVTWRSSKMGWMVTALFEEFLYDLNSRMAAQNRHILLFLDNAPSHPQDLEFSHVNLLFFPNNTSSVLQPLDQGVIHTIKLHYKKRLLDYLAAKSRDSVDMKSIVSGIDMDLVVDWIDLSVQAVKPSTVTACFVKSGFVTGESTDPTMDENPILGPALQELQCNLHITDPMTMTAEEYEALDEGLPTHSLNEDDWIHARLAGGGQNEEPSPAPSPATFPTECVDTSNLEVLKMLETIERHYRYRMADECLELCQNLKQKHVAYMKANRHRQTTLKEYFKKIQ